MPTSDFHDPGVVQALIYSIQLAVGATFAVAVVPKLYRPSRFRRIVAGYDLFPQLAAVAAIAVMAAEASIAVALLTGLLMAVVLPLALGVVALFAFATGVNLARGRNVECGCFGGSEERISARSLARLLVLGLALACLATALATGTAHPTTASWLASHATASLAYFVEVAGLALALTIAAVWLLNARGLLAILEPAWRGEAR
ncbi:MAG: hypothetical protein M3Y09_01830 [Actinomycetota bacterium]|nr:hypothetical protein [Actinomycetota bacterium]